MSKKTGRRNIDRFMMWAGTGVGILTSLGLGYLFLAGSRYSRLIGFFAYMSIACTLIPLPSPPYVIGLGKVFHPGIVALVGAVANCLAAFGEYHVIRWLTSKTELEQRVTANRVFQRFAYYFQRAAFVCLVFTGFTPIPFEPFRFAAILIHYNMPKYLLAVFVGRFPRYYLIAMIGERLQVANRYLILLLVALLVIPIISILIKRCFSADDL